MSKKVLVIDIGNTNIVVGVFDGDALVVEFRLKTDSARTLDEYDALLIPLFERKFGPALSFDSSVISSVVPPITPTFARLVRERFGVEPLMIGPGIKTGLAIKIPEPTSLGADRIVNAVAAKTLFGTPALIIDFGTATSFDYIDRTGNYMGGIIAPGAMISLDALVRNTAKLPRIELAWPKTVVGNTTVSAMQSGAVVGYLSLIEGLITRVLEEVGPIEHIIATGGLGKLFSEHSIMIKQYDAQLTLKGMRILSELNPEGTR